MWHEEGIPDEDLSRLSDLGLRFERDQPSLEVAVPEIW